MALIRRKKTEDNGLNRRERIVPPPYQEFPRGGHVPDAPEGCEWRKKFEQAGTFWTETYYCGFVCEQAINCKAYIKYQRELPKRRKGN